MTRYQAIVYGPGLDTKALDDEKYGAMIIDLTINPYSNGYCRFHWFSDKGTRVGVERGRGTNMKITITGRNVKVTDKINDVIEKKFSKIEKYFSGDAEAKILIRPEGDKIKFEAMILGKGFNLRAESVKQDIFDAIEDASNRLNSQMAKAKGKMEHRYQGIESIRFEMLPKEDDAPKIVKIKRHHLAIMDPEDATVEMELLGHDFYLFVNEETDTVCAVYKRNDGDYGLLETDY